jgi:Uncharacterized conserved protein
MDFLAKHSVKKDAKEAVDDLAKQFSGQAIKQLMFFASSRFKSDNIGKLMADAFPGVVTFGCTSFEEYSGCKLYDGSIAAMAFGPDAFDEFVVTVADDIEHNPDGINNALTRLEKDLAKDIATLDYTEYFGLILFDGDPVKNIDTIIASSGDRSDIVFIGGCASDHFTHSDTALFLNGVKYNRAAMLAIIKPKKPFALFKTQNAVSTGKEFMVTGSDEDRKILKTLDGRPAVEVYAEALGLKPEQLTPSILGRHPLGIVNFNEPFLRAIDSLVPGGGIRLIYPLEEGVPVSVFSTTDLIETTAHSLAEKHKEIGPFRAVINFDCALRSIVLKNSGDLDKYGKLFGDAEMIGFSTYGEAYISFSTQTAVMAVFS